MVCLLVCSDCLFERFVCLQLGGFVCIVELLGYSFVCLGVVIVFGFVCGGVVD